MKSFFSRLWRRLKPPPRPRCVHRWDKGTLHPKGYLVIKCKNCPASYIVAKLDGR